MTDAMLVAYESRWIAGEFSSRDLDALTREIRRLRDEHAAEKHLRMQLQRRQSRGESRRHGAARHPAPAPSSTD